MNKSELSSRAVALDILQGVLRRKQPFDELLERNAALDALEKRDRGFVHLLVATVLRRLGQIDDAIAKCLDKPEQLKKVVEDLLRLGAAQLLFLQTPPHAAVDTIVSLAASDPATMPYKGLLNAVLRRLSREGAALVKLQDAPKLNTPTWLWLSWRQTYGVAIARNIASANNGEALNDISVKTDVESWAQKLGGRLLPTGSIRLDQAGAVTELPGFDDGAWWVQDAAAALPVKLMGDVAGQRVVDLCAAPGGKSAQLAVAGAQVVAVDRAEKRLKRLQENFARLGLSAEVVCSDALKYIPTEKADAVLLDAPCSSTGTIRRHPDVLRLKLKEDVARLAALQAALLDHTIHHVLKPGGLLLYAVCSLQPEEAEAQIAEFLARHDRVKREPIRAEEVGGCAELINAQGDLRCLPSHWEKSGGIDGFFAARLRFMA